MHIAYISLKVSSYTLELTTLFLTYKLNTRKLLQTYYLCFTILQLNNNLTTKLDIYGVTRIPGRKGDRSTKVPESDVDLSQTR